MEMKFSKLSILENSKNQKKKKTIFNKFLTFFFTFFQSQKINKTANVYYIYDNKITKKSIYVKIIYNSIRLLYL